MDALAQEVIADGPKAGLSFGVACNDLQFLNKASRMRDNGSASKKRLIAYAKARLSIQSLEPGRKEAPAETGAGILVPLAIKDAVCPMKSKSNFDILFMEKMGVPELWKKIMQSLFLLRRPRSLQWE